MAYVTADPETVPNEMALELTQLHLKQAAEIAGNRSELLPALIVALAVNRQTIQQMNDASK